LQQADGGWSLSSFDRTERVDKTPQATASDGYATALVALALEANMANADGNDASLHSALTWLEQHQGKDGRWPASSLNKQRDPESNIGKFMSDTATAYAALALEQSAAMATP
jgi:squalene-hopene/tetraprenyl-beta-curcumene cyclase